MFSKYVTHPFIRKDGIVKKSNTSHKNIEKKLETFLEKQISLIIKNKKIYIENLGYYFVKDDLVFHGSVSLKDTLFKKKDIIDFLTQIANKSLESLIQFHKSKYENLKDVEEDIEITKEPLFNIFFWKIKYKLPQTQKKTKKPFIQNIETYDDKDIKSKKTNKAKNIIDSISKQEKISNSKKK